MTPSPRSRPAAACPVRRGDPCSLCEPEVEGPHDCGLVYLVMSDPDLRELYREQLARRDDDPAVTASDEPG